MDGRITALRVGFLSSSHQLAGLNFPLPALLNTTQGLYPFIGVFAAFFKCWIGLAVWQVWLWSSGSLFFFIFFLPPTIGLRGFRQGESAARRLPPQLPALLGKTCLSLILRGCFPFPACVEKFGLPTGRRASADAPPHTRCPGSECRLLCFGCFFFLLNLSRFNACRLCMCVFFLFNLVLNLVWLAVNGAWLVLGD